jgi:hypothetical protein
MQDSVCADAAKALHDCMRLAVGAKLYFLDRTAQLMRYLCVLIASQATGAQANNKLPPGSSGQELATQIVASLLDILTYITRTIH